MHYHYIFFFFFPFRFQTLSSAFIFVTFYARGFSQIFACILLMTKLKIFLSIQWQNFACKHCEQLHEHIMVIWWCHDYFIVAFRNISTKKECCIPAFLVQGYSIFPIVSSLWITHASTASAYSCAARYTNVTISHRLQVFMGEKVSFPVPAARSFSAIQSTAL